MQWNITILFHYHQHLRNLGFKEEWLEVHGGVPHNVHQDGWHVHSHEHTQETSPKNNLGKYHKL